MTSPKFEPWTSLDNLKFKYSWVLTLKLCLLSTISRIYDAEKFCSKLCGHNEELILNRYNFAFPKTLFSFTEWNCSQATQWINQQNASQHRSISVLPELKYLRVFKVGTRALIIPSRKCLYTKARPELFLKSLSRQKHEWGCKLPCKINDTEIQRCDHQKQLFVLVGYKNILYKV